jgi:hypothetical protein
MALIILSGQEFKDIVSLESINPTFLGLSIWNKIWKIKFEEHFLTDDYQRSLNPREKDVSGKSDIKTTLDILGLNIDEGNDNYWREFFKRIKISPRFDRERRNLYVVHNFGITCSRLISTNTLTGDTYLSGCQINTEIKLSHPYIEIISNCGFCLSSTKEVAKEFDIAYKSKDPSRCYPGYPSKGTTFYYLGMVIY